MTMTQEKGTGFECILASDFIFRVFFWPCCMACGILVPQPGIEPRPWQ